MIASGEGRRRPGVDDKGESEKVLKLIEPSGCMHLMEGTEAEIKERRVKGLVRLDGRRFEDHRKRDMLTDFATLDQRNEIV